MSMWPKDYEIYVLDYLRENKGKQEVTKAGLLERIRIKRLDPLLLHPNPEDEFSMEAIGPNLGIVNNYVKSVKTLELQELPVFEEAVICEKLKKGGYIIVNGHHRWLAALRIGLKKLHVKIVNLVHTEDLHRMLGSTSNTRCVAFDLDEVLFSKDPSDGSVIIDPVLAAKIPYRLRAGAPEVIRAFREKNYDIWIYTARYFSEGEINLFFEAYDLKITGAINGIGTKRAELSDYRKKLQGKYQERIHIDNESMVVTHSNSKDFTLLELEDRSNWSGSILKMIDQLKG